MAKVVRYTRRAEADLSDIWSTIAQDNERAADSFIRRIAQKATLAADMPYMGVAKPELGPKARILVAGAYIIIYEAEPEGVAVIAVVHGMRDPENWI